MTSVSGIEAENLTAPIPVVTGRPRWRDTAIALRCLTAHRESVAREKGRRTLADEVATIASINAKIDDMRARSKAGDAAVRKARRDAAKARGNG